MNDSSQTRRQQSSRLPMKSTIVWSKKMNAKKMIAAIALSTLAGSVFAAGQNEFVDYTNVKTEKTRTEVRAELAEANAQGQVTHAPEFVETERVASTRSRDEVRKEATRSAKAVERNTSFVNYGA
jgi:hypothetical protein